jgi:hypothetical protein
LCNNDESLLLLEAAEISLAANACAFLSADADGVGVASDGEYAEPERE